MGDYMILAAVGNPVYGYEMDPATFTKKKKVIIGKEYSVVGLVKSKKAALKVAYRFAKRTPQKHVEIRDMDANNKRNYVWGTVLWTDNPKAWYYNKAIVHSMDDLSNWRQLKYDGSVGKIIRRY